MGSLPDLLLESALYQDPTRGGLFPDPSRYLLKWYNGVPYTEVQTTCFL